jgi:hypothetical protein
MTVQDEERVGSCWECGYSLRGLETARCPECGRKFDPRDEATMNMGRKVQRLVRWLMRPPGWPMRLLTAMAALTSVWAAATPMSRGHLAVLSCRLLIGDEFAWRRLSNQMHLLGSSDAHYLIGLLLWLIVAAAWTFRRIARGITVRRLSNQKPATFAYWRRWLFTPLTLGATLIACWTRIPVVMGFWLSKPALETVVKDVRALPRPPSMTSGHQPSNWIGIYPPWDLSPIGSSHRIWDYQGETWIYLQHNGAFVYRDDGQPPSHGVETPWRSFGSPNVHHLYGPWYSVDWHAAI